ncbi:ATP-binding protein [Phocaeicola sp.]
MPRLSTQLKVASGYILLTLLLFVSIYYINSEMKALTETDNNEAVLSLRRRATNEIVGQLYQAEIIGQSLSAGQLEQYSRYKTSMRKATDAVDSLRNLLTDSMQLARLDTVEILLLEKERNMRSLLRAIREGGTDKIYRQHVEELIAEQDSLLSLPHVRRKVVTHTNSYTIHKKPKSFMKRLGEVFSPGKGDSTQVSNVIQEEFTDTLTESYSPADTVATLLKDVQSRVTDTHQQQMKMLNQRTQSLRVSGLKLSQKVNQLLSTIDDEGLVMARRKQVQEEEIRQSSAHTVAAIAIVAVLLASIFLILIWRDITRSNHYRRELEKAKRRAEDLLVAREKLMLTITHDIKAPVGSILGYTDLLERITTEERQRFYLSNMQSSANHLLSLVNSLLDYHRLDAHKMDVNRVAFNPHQLFDTIYTSYKPMATAKHLEVIYECGTPLNRLFIGDPFRIRQIAENLLSNALKFTQKGSITLRAALENGKLHFSISDTGCGITPEEQQRIFQEFTRLHNAQGQEGFGLGLAITRKLVHLLEGDINIESESGKGSSFHVYLPLPEAPDSFKTEADSPAPVSNNSLETLAATTPLHLLLIDDDRIQLQLTAAMLNSPGIAVTCCEQPEDLFTKLKHESFDVLLTDIQMPAMNGFDLLKAIRALSVPQAQTIPVIAITARSDMDAAYFRSKGFAGCLHKPFTIREISEAIAEAAARKVNLTEHPQPETLSPPAAALNFSALTAFSEDDPDAAAEIIRTFISETEKNRKCLETALKEENMEGIAAMAHKLLPLFTMLGATACLPPLSWLEQKRGTTEVNKEVCEKTAFILKEIEEIIHQAKMQV